MSSRRRRPGRYHGRESRFRCTSKFRAARDSVGGGGGEKPGKLGLRFGRIRLDWLGFAGAAEAQWHARRAARAGACGGVGTWVLGMRVLVPECVVFSVAFGWVRVL